MPRNSRAGLLILFRNTGLGIKARAEGCTATATTGAANFREIAPGAGYYYSAGRDPPRRLQESPCSSVSSCSLRAPKQRLANLSTAARTYPPASPRRRPLQCPCPHPDRLAVFRLLMTSTIPRPQRPPVIKWGIQKVAEMLSSPHLQGMSLDAKRASLLMALKPRTCASRTCCRTPCSASAP